MSGWMVVVALTALAIGAVVGIQIQGADIANHCTHLGKFRYGGQTFLCMPQGEQRTKQI